ncbi:hypothetical protein DNU06_13205 [Putridiphycobacter roseus]|uniref:Uncharacterized protein n=2 Tax=Putridiphycobacter roseus TaxID=2219161 RepID=A0A2W1NPF0_9FLAO|nr:hypothetical protein DNU06_13205 [Putridiphycobacter roseus]
MYEGNYELAINNFEMAFELVDQAKARDYYLTSKCYAQLNKEDLMYHFLEAALRNGLDKNFVISDSLWFTSFSNSSTFKEVLQIAPLTSPVEIDKTGEEALLAIDKMFEIEIMFAYYKAERQKDSLPDAYKIYFNNYTAYRDSMQKHLVYYYLNYSIPTTKPLQLKLKRLTLFLMDKSVPEMDQINDILIESIDQGVLYPYYVAFLIDNLGPNSLKPFRYSNQLYGTTENSVPKTNFNEILDNRKAVGLSTYYYDAPSYVKNYKPTPIINIIRPNPVTINKDE